MDQNVTYDDMSDMIAGMMQSIVEDYGDEAGEKATQKENPAQDEKPES